MNTQEVTRFTVTDYIFSRVSDLATDLTWTYTQVQYIIKPLTAVAAAQSNNRALCGLTNWAAGVSQVFANSGACFANQLVTTYWRERYDEDPLDPAKYRMFIADASTGRGDTPATRATGLLTGAGDIRRAPRPPLVDKQATIFVQ